jgi:hypothetical protein
MSTRPLAQRRACLHALLALAFAGSGEPDARAPADPHRLPRLSGFARVLPAGSVPAPGAAAAAPFTTEGAGPARTPFAAGSVVPHPAAATPSCAALPGPDNPPVPAHGAR